MQKIIFIIAILLFGMNFCAAQKMIQKEFSADGIKTLIIEDDAVFTIHVETAKTSTIVLKVQSSGEYSETIVIDERQTGSNLFLKTGLMPFFVKENDKLAANKTMSIEMQIILPEDMKLRIKSKLASVIATGAFKNLEIGLEKGRCLLKDFLGNAVLQTQDENITVYAVKTVTGKATSQHGQVVNELPKNGKYHIMAESINGSISLLQTK